MKTLLFNPGPTNVSNDVRDAIKTRDICHREPEFFEGPASANRQMPRNRPVSLRVEYGSARNSENEYLSAAKFYIAILIDP